MLIVDAIRTTHSKELLIIISIVVGAGLFSAIYLYSHDKYSLIYYSDSVSHLVRSREIVDSSNPGLFEQLGTVWLPVPHLLLLPFTLIDPLFNTGLAGLAVSLPCLIITSILLYRLLKIHLGVAYVAVIGALLYTLNLNILYVSLTPMTEAPFMMFFVASAYYFQKWLLPSKRYIDTQKGQILLQKNNTLSGYINPSSQLYNLIKCSICISLATLCRYEGWFLPIFLVLVVIIFTIRSKYNYEKKYKVAAIILSLISFSGIALWLIWNAYNYGDALEFARAPYFSASSQAVERSNRAGLYLQPLNVASVYSVTAISMYGPLLLAAAFFGYLFHKHFGTKQEETRRRNLYIFLAMPAIFTILSMIIGIGEMNLRQWFNSRFLILLAPLVILLACILIARIPEVGKRFIPRISDERKKYVLVAALVGILFIYQLVVTPVLGIVTFLNAEYQFGGSRPFQIKTVQALKSIYDGNSRIMLITGSAQQNKIMHLSGIPLRQFDQILESDRSQDSFKEPWSHANYMIIGKRPDASAKLAAHYWLGKEDVLAPHFNKVYEDKYYEVLMSRNTNSSVPTPNIPNMIQNPTDINYAEHNGKLLLHRHAFLNVTVDNKHITVPANIGIDPLLYKDHSLDAYGPLGKSPLHTHTATGTIHVESKVVANYTLGEFLSVWGGLDLRNKAVKMTIEGKPVTNFQNHILNDKEHINLIVCSVVRSLNQNSC
ncbi:MAG TPA: hypothetical protein VE076_07610 [Nitrososphaeraceae archaeon]|jgi:hypothetical protein|nr:hypothetical protein [Nitrososphaeraceae archaeon]